MNKPTKSTRGGARKGAGRKFSTVILKSGQDVTVWLGEPPVPYRAVVTVTARNEIRIKSEIVKEITIQTEKEPTK